MKLYCTLTRSKRAFVPQTPTHTTIYVCGPTVYNFVHIGNARPPVVFDVLRRFLEHKGHNVTYVQNFTDIDDKIITAAAQQNISPAALSNKFITEFLTDMQGLNVKPATTHPKVTDEIPEIISLIQTLMDKGFAYTVEGTVYFRAQKADNYGKLSKKNIDELESGARVETNTNKAHTSDFVLWKAAKPNEPAWPSPFGPGRPGWHIECSALTRKYLGTTIDIHCGGQDLIFPHHENEIAQTEAAQNAPLANYWLHNGMILFEKQKMSKSTGNFFLVRDIAKAFPYEVIRFFILSVHYRSPLNFSDELLTAAQSGLERIKNCKRSILEKLPTAPDHSSPETTEITRFHQDFEAALNDDLNTANAITALFELVKFTNKNLAHAGKEFLQTASDIIDFFCQILGLKLQLDAGTHHNTTEIQDLITQRNAAKAAKDFSRADQIRADLAALGVTIKDTREGTIWHFTNN